MNERKRLGSWKEIAAHLHVETRTAMRWEHERALPVHRVPGGGRAAVFAYEDEIDAWLHGQPAAALKEDAVVQPDGADGPDGISATAAPEAAQQAPRRLSRGAVIALVSALAVVLFVVFAMVWRGGGEREVVRVSFAGEKLVAWDAANREVWSHEFPGMLQAPGGGTWNGGAERSRMVDLDGDGKREVLAVVLLPTGPNLDDPYYGELHCYSLDGKLRWRYRPENTLNFRDQEFAGPWIIYDYLVSPPRPQRTIWLAVNHHLWWPAFVVKLDAAGHSAVQFVNSGTINALGFVRNVAGTYLLAGGINNEPYAGMMAVLDVNQPPAISPQTAGSEFQCQNCPTGAPVRYVVFPHTEINRLVRRSFNPVNTFLIFSNQIEASVLEEPAVPAFYDFSNDSEMRPTGLRFGDGFRVTHQRLEQEGKLKHSFEQCPDRLRPKTVREWTPGQGWRDLAVPSISSQH